MHGGFFLVKKPLCSAGISIHPLENNCNAWEGIMRSFHSKWTGKKFQSKWTRRKIRPVGCAVVEAAAVAIVPMAPATAHASSEQ